MSYPRPKKERPEVRGTIVCLIFLPFFFRLSFDRNYGYGSFANVSYPVSSGHITND